MRAAPGAKPALARLLRRVPVRQAIAQLGLLAQLGLIAALLTGCWSTTLRVQAASPESPALTGVETLPVQRLARLAVHAEALVVEVEDVSPCRERVVVRQARGMIETRKATTLVKVATGVLTVVGASAVMSGGVAGIPPLAAAAAIYLPAALASGETHRALVPAEVHSAAAVRVCSAQPAAAVAVTLATADGLHHAVTTADGRAHFPQLRQRLGVATPVIYLDGAPARAHLGP